jgi:F-type H+-transporting ATPase subunit b
MEEEAMINVDSSLFIQIGNFLLLIWILNMVLYKPIRKILKERDNKIDGFRKGIGNAHQSAKEKEKNFNDAMSDARTKGIKEKEALAQAAMDQEKKIIDEINKKAHAEIEAVRAKIAKEVEAARQGLNKEIQSFAEAIGQKILGRTI